MEKLSIRTINELKYRRRRILDGNVNCIPSPFHRFSTDFAGLEQGCYYTITAATKGGKSQFTSFLFIYKALMFCYNNKSDIDIKVIYFPLEESKERVMQRFMSWLLYYMSNGSLHISPKDLRSTVKAVDERIIELLESPEYNAIIEYFEDHVIFPEESGNPTGIYNFCRKYAEEHGTVHYRKVRMKDKMGNFRDEDVFDYYTPDNPNEYRFIIIDTINLIDTERGMTLKESMNKLSEYCAKYLRNRYNYSPVIIQQQAFSTESLDAIKLDKIRPTVAALGDSKYTSRDSNVVFGLFSPYRFGLKSFGDYDITKFRDNIRFIEILVNRDGEMGGMCPLFFDGAVCNFEELPKPNETSAIAQYYSRMNTMRGMPNQASFFLLVDRLFKRNKRHRVCA